MAELYNPQGPGHLGRLDAIDRYLAGQSGSDVRLAALMGVALKRILAQREKNLSPLAELPYDAPEWARAKWGAVDFVVFDPTKDARLDGQVKHIADWIKAALINRNSGDDLAGTAWLDDTDAKGRPKKLLKLGSLEQATAEADKAMRVGVMKHSQNYGDLAVEVAKDPHVEIIKAYDDNKYFMVRILDATGLDIESANMGHCVGNGAYDQKIEAGDVNIYSLRDDRNRPHATLEISGNGDAMWQCKGKGNRMPSAKYFCYINDFITGKNSSLPNSWDCVANTGIFFSDGKFQTVTGSAENQNEDF